MGGGGVFLGVGALGYRRKFGVLPPEWCGGGMQGGGGARDKKFGISPLECTVFGIGVNHF